MNSKVIKKVVWRDKSLHITFSTGKTYRYEDVPSEVHENFISSESLGRFFSTQIRGVYKEEYIGVHGTDPFDQIDNCVVQSADLEPLLEWSADEEAEFLRLLNNSDE